MKSQILLSTIGALVLGVASPTLAGTIAVTTTPDQVFSNTGTWTLGWSFVVNSPISVTSLGAYDADGDGLNVAHDVGLWDSLGNLLASTTVPSGTAGTLDSGYRFVSISSIPLSVDSTYYVGAVYFVDDSDGWLQDPLTLVTAPEIIYDSRRYEISNGTLVFPDLAGSGLTGYFGGNFEFQATGATPEPASFALIAGGLAILVVGRKRRALRALGKLGQAQVH